MTADPSLLALSDLVVRFTGHAEDISPDSRLQLLGQFAGAVLRLRDEVSGLYADCVTVNTWALPALHQVMLALGAPDNWTPGAPGNRSMPEDGGPGNFIVLHPGELEELDRIAERNGMTRSALVRTALKRTEAT